MNTTAATIYSDGACFPNPGKGAWCCIIHWNEKEIVVSGIEENSTNNRMETMGLLKCLPELGSRGITHIKVVSDSKYLGYGLNWRGKNRKKLNKVNLINKDLWIPLHECMDRFNLEIEYEWVKGHNGHPQNERCNAIVEKLVQQ